MNTRLSKSTGFLLLIGLLLLAVMPLAAQEEAGVARVRIGYFAFDPREYDTYVDGKVFPFDNEIRVHGWSVRCFSIRCVTASPFFSFAEGVHSFAIAPQGGDADAAVVGPKEFTFEAGHVYSIGVVGSLEENSLDLILVEDSKLLGDADLAKSFLAILVNNVSGLPAIELKENNVTQSIDYRGFVSRIFEVGTVLVFDLNTSTSGARMFNMVSIPVPARVSDFGAFFGRYPGTYAYERQYYYAANWGYPGMIETLDGGIVEVGTAVQGEVKVVAQRTAYTLMLEADSVVNITVHGTGSHYNDTISLIGTKFDPAVYVFNDQKELLTWNNTVSAQQFLAGNLDAQIEKLKLPSGTYRIEVGGGDDLVSGPYELLIELAE